MDKNDTHNFGRLIDKKELRKLVLYSNSQIAQLKSQGAFPKRIRLGPRRVAWDLSEVTSWLHQRAADN